MRRMSSLMILVIITVPLLLTACQRSASVNPGAVNNPTAVVEVIATENPAQQSIGETQTQVANPTATPLVTLLVVPTNTPEAEATLVEIIATITPTLPATDVPEEIAIPTVKKPVSYVMQAMENTYCIARRFNVDIGELLSINKLTTESVVEAGTSIDLPYTGHQWSSGPRALLPHPVKYTVKSGDTIYSIACQYGDVSPEAIIAVNKLSEPVSLQNGQVIDIP